jgi:hypothetical protein
MDDLSTEILLSEALRFSGQPHTSQNKVRDHLLSSSKHPLQKPTPKEKPAKPAFLITKR